MDNFNGIKENVELVRTIDWWNVVIGVLVAIGILFVLYYAKEFLTDKLGITTKKSLAKQAQEQKIINLQEEMIGLHKEIQQFKDARIHDREQSFNIQKELTDKQDVTAQTLENVNGKLDDLAQALKDMQDKEDFKERSKLKDRISQSYRFYHKEQKWNKMDQEAFNDLIKAYEASGGPNSFVHSVCEPESLTWEIID
jgi:hypothetical protein